MRFEFENDIVKRRNGVILNDKIEPCQICGSYTMFLDMHTELPTCSTQCVMEVEARNRISIKDKEK